MKRHETLEQLLRTTLAENEAGRVASFLLHRFGTLAGVLEAPLFQLEKIPGMNRPLSSLIKVVKRLAELYFLDRIKKRKGGPVSRDAVDFSVIKLAGRPHEAFLVVYLNARNDILHEEIISEGTVDHVTVYPRRIIETALNTHASAIILAHNHPGGGTKPSREDKALTRRIKEAGELLDIVLLDHIIVGRRDYYSFRTHRLL